MTIQEALHRDFQKLLTNTVQSWHTDIVYYRVTNTTVDPATGQVMENILQIPIKSIRTLVDPKELLLQQAMLAPATVIHYVSTEDLYFEPTKSDYIVDNGVKFEIFEWQIDTDENVYRLRCRRFE